MKILYFILCFLSITLIYPFSDNGADIWTHPKIAIFFILSLLNFFQIFKIKFIYFKNEFIIFWVLFLLFGSLITVLSPMPMRSFYGNLMIGDGLIHYFFIGLFSCSNYLVLKNNRTVFKAQALGFFAGCVTLSLVVAIQWASHLCGFDISLGLSNPDLDGLLVGTLWDPQMPIGLFSHRGHAGIVLVMGLLLGIVLYFQKLIKSRVFYSLLIMIAFAALSVNTRVVSVLCILSLGYCFLYLQRRHKLFVAIIALAIAASIFIISKKADRLDEYTGGRTYYWKLAMQGISERPIFGWGFNGFGTAYPFIIGCTDLKTFKTSAKVVDRDTYDPQDDIEGYKKSCDILTTKLHQNFLDAIISWGIPLTCFYFLGVFYFLFLIFRANSFKSFEIIFLFHFAYTLLWYESSQYSYLAWWALGATLVNKTLVLDRDLP